jgi:hypothetical protein
VCVGVQYKMLCSGPSAAMPQAKENDILAVVQVYEMTPDLHMIEFKQDKVCRSASQRIRPADTPSPAVAVALTLSLCCIVLCAAASLCGPALWCGAV